MHWLHACKTACIGMHCLHGDHLVSDVGGRTREGTTRGVWRSPPLVKNENGEATKLHVVLHYTF